MRIVRHLGQPQQKTGTVAFGERRQRRVGRMKALSLYTIGEQHLVTSEHEMDIGHLLHMRVEAH